MEIVLDCTNNKPFSDVFPSIEDMKVVVKLGGDYGVSELNSENHFGTNVTEYYIPCTNPMCHEGGFSVDNLIKRMVASNETRLQKDYIPCQGFENPSNWTGRNHRCTNFFSVRIDIKYKSKSTDESA